jgi:hypothetical protein
MKEAVSFETLLILYDNMPLHIPNENNAYSQHSPQPKSQISQLTSRLLFRNASIFRTRWKAMTRSSPSSLLHP